MLSSISAAKEIKYAKMFAVEAQILFNMRHDSIVRIIELDMVDLCISWN